MFIGEKYVVSHSRLITSHSDCINYCLIIIPTWDEIFSVNRFNVECVERTLRDLMHSQQPWGGKTVLLGGDPRQTLPVIKRASRAQIVTACIQMSPLYPGMKHHKLQTNMRTDADEKHFSNYLLALGEGKLSHDTEVHILLSTQTSEK